MNLYISDLDGTLLDEAGCLSNESKEGLLKLMALDVQFTVQVQEVFSQFKGC